MSIIKMNFNTDIAKLVGTDAAIIYSNIEYWVEHNKLNEKHFYDGNYWTYNSIEAFKKYFDYLSVSQIKTCIKKLEKHNLIEIGNYNKLGYDRTKWYSIPLNSTIGEKSQMDYSDLTNGLAKIDQPIPNYKPDIKKEDKINFDNLILYYNKVLNKKCKIIPKDVKIKFNNLLKDGYEKSDIRKVIDNVSFDTNHKENNFKYVTFEFLSRPKIFERYASMEHKKPQNKDGHINW